MENRLQDVHNGIMGKYIRHFLDTYVVVDIETTGLCSNEDEIIEIGAIKVQDHEVIDTFQVFITPQKEISSFITHLTGITNEMVKEKGISATEAFAQFLVFCDGYVLLGHNVTFDLRFLSYHILQELGVLLEDDYADTCRLARQYLQGRVPNCKLGTLIQYFGLEYTGAHRALADCEFTRKVYQALLEVSCGFRD